MKYHHAKSSQKDQLLEWIMYGEYVDGKPCNAEDIETTIKKDYTLWEALCLIEEKAKKYVISQGAKDIRQFFIENVIIEDNIVSFQYGT